MKKKKSKKKVFLVLSDNAGTVIKEEIKPYVFDALLRAIEHVKSTQGL